MAGAGGAKASHNNGIAGNPARGAGDMAVKIHPTAIVEPGATATEIAASITDLIDDQAERALGKEGAAALKEANKLLGSEKIKTSTAERSLLKHIGSWLGRITLARSRPLLRGLRRARSCAQGDQAEPSQGQSGQSHRHQ